MNTNNGSKKNMTQTLDVCLGFVPMENWQMRLLKAFEMLMEDNDSSGLTKGSLGSIIGAQEKGGVSK